MIGLRTLTLAELVGIARSPVMARPVNPIRTEFQERVRRECLEY